MAAYFIGIIFVVGAMAASFMWMAGRVEYPTRALIVAIVFGILSAICMRIGIYMERRGLM